MGPGQALIQRITDRCRVEQEELTDAKADNKDRDGYKSSLVADVERLGNTAHVGGDDTGAEGDDKACDGHDHGDIPLERL